MATGEGRGRFQFPIFPITNRWLVVIVLSFPTLFPGFDTQKGALVRSILFPKPVDFQFYADFSKYVVFCLVLGLVAACYSAYAWTANNVSALIQLV